MEGSEESIWKGRTPLIVLMLCCGILGILNLGLFRHDYDEGQYIALAHAIASGEVPFKDFFYHQPAYFLYLLSWMPSPATDTIWLYRLPSFLGTWLTGGVLYYLARDGLKLRLSILVPALFYGSLFMSAGRLALPHGLMVFGTTLGIYLIFVRGKREHVVMGAVVMAMAVCLKALAISSVIAVALALAVLPAHRWKLLWFCLTVAAVGLMGILGLHFLSDGGFTHALTLQLSRTSAQSGVRIMKSLPGLAEDMDTLGEVSSLTFNVAIHGIAFTELPLSFPGNYIFANNTLQAVILAGVGLYWLKARRQQGPWFTVLGLWWLMAFLFILFVWSPSWKDYLIQYAAPMSLLGGFCLDELWSREKYPLLMRLVVIGLLAVTTLTMIAATDKGIEAEANEVSRIQKNTYQSMDWLTFDPYLTFQTGSPEACGLRDPLTAFGLPTNLPGFEVFSGEQRTIADVIACLQKAEPTGIWIDDESLMYIDQQFARYLMCQNGHLVVYHERDHARRLRARVGLEVLEGQICGEGW